MATNMDPLNTLPPVSTVPFTTFSNDSQPVSAPAQPVNLYDEVGKAFNDLSKAGKVYRGQSDLTQIYDYNDAAPYLQGFGSSGFVGPGSDEFNAQNQRWYHQLTNGTLKMAGIASTSFINGTVGFLNGIGSVINSGINGNLDFSKFYDNDTTKAMDQVNKDMERWFPNYYTNKEKNADALSADNLFTMNFLADKLIKNAGYAIGAIGTGYAYGALARAIGIGKLAGMYTKGVNNGTIEPLIMSVGDDIANQGFKAIELAAKQNRNAQVIADTWVNRVAMTMSSMGEANMEALEGLNTVRDRLISEQETVLGRPLTSEEMESIESRAKESANYRWALNTALLNVTNRIQFPKILGEKNFAGQRTILNREINDIAVQNAAKETTGKVAARAGESYVNKAAKENLSKWAQVGDIAKKVGTTLISPSETFEEGAQFIFERGTSKFADYQTTVADYLDNQNHPEYRSLLRDTISYGVPQLFSEKEGIESLILGGLTGGIMESVTGGDRAVQKRKDQNTQNFLKYINENSVTPYMKERENFAVNDMVSEQKRADAIARNDVYTAFNERTNGWLNFALPRLFYGRKDLATEELMQYHSSRMAFDVAKQELGLSDKMTQAELDKNIQDSINDLEKLDKMLTHVEAIYPAMYGKDGTINPLAKGLVFATYKIDDFEQRISKLMGEMSSLGLTDIGLMTNPKLRNEAGMSLEELRNKLNKDLKEAVKNKTANGVPIDLEEQAAKLNDIERLQNLRETYINDYNQIRKQEFLTNLDLSQGNLNDDTKVEDYLAFERHRWNTQRVSNYQSNTDMRLKAMKLSNYLEKAVIGKQDLTNDEMQDMLNMLENDLTYFYPEDRAHINTLLNTIKSTSDVELKAALGGKIDSYHKYNLEEALKGTSGENPEDIIDDLKENYKSYVDGVDTTEDAYEALFNAFDKSKARMDLYNKLDKSFNNPNRPTEPTKKTENDIRRDIAKEFENVASLVISSYKLDEEGFDDTEVVQNAITKIKNLKRVFDKRGDEFFIGNKAFGTKAEYMKELDDLLAQLDTVLIAAKKNVENIQKNDNNYAQQNKLFKAAIVGWSTNTDSPDNDEIYKAISNIIGKTELDDLLKKHKASDDERYAYEIFQKVRNAVNADKSLGLKLQTVIDTEIAKLKTIFSKFEGRNIDSSLTLSDPSKSLWYNKPYSYYDDLLDSLVNDDELKSIYRKSKNIQDVIDYLKANPSIEIRKSAFTLNEVIEHFTNGEKLRALDNLSKINNVSPSFNFTQYWQAVNKKVESLHKEGIVPTMRQIQVIEDIVLDLFTSKDSGKAFDTWTYFNGRIGSGKTRVIAQTLIDVVNTITNETDSNKTVYLTGDKNIAGINLETALNLKQSVVEEADGRLSGGRSIDTLIEDLNKDADTLKQVRFILGDEYARASTNKLIELAEALAKFNSRNNLDLRMVAMGDTLQATENFANDNIKGVSKLISLTTELSTSYRSPLFSINVVQSLFDNAMYKNVLDSNIKVVHYKELNNDGTPKMDTVWLGVTGVAKGTKFDAAEADMISEVAQRSKVRVKEQGTNKDIPVTNILIVTNSDNVARIQASLLIQGADMSVIDVKNIEDAQGLTSPDVYVHLNPNSAEYKKDMRKYNRHMYTALRASRYLHITTLETENVQDMALFARYDSILQSMRNVNNKIKDDVNNIKTHLETVFKVNPLPSTTTTSAPSATTKTTTGTTTATSGTGSAPVVKTPYATTYVYKVPDSIDSTDIDDTPIDTSFPAEVTAVEEWKQIVEKVNNIANQIKDLIDTKVPNLENLDDELEFKKEYDNLAQQYNDAIAELVKKQDEIVALLDARGAVSNIVNPSELTEPESNEAVSNEETKNTAGPERKLIPFTSGPDSIDSLGNEENRWFEVADNSGQERYVESNKPKFVRNEDDNVTEEVQVANPTSRAFKNNTGIPLTPNSEVEIIPVQLSNGKLVYGVYMPITIDDTLYYHELGVLSTEQVKSLIQRGIISSVITENYKAIPQNIRDIDGVNTTVFKINKPQSDPAVGIAELRDIQSIQYEYNYASKTPTERDGVDMQTLLDRWISSAGLTKEEFDSRYKVRIETISGKSAERHRERFEEIYDVQTDNLTPIVPGRTYIVIVPNDTTKLPQYIELEERALVLDDKTLANPDNVIMKDWYITPLTKFVQSVDAYDNVVKDVLTSIGITIDDLNEFIKSITYTVPGTDIKIVEDVNEFKHGNSVYNDLMYAFVNMSYNETTWFKGRGNKFDKEGNEKYIAKAKPFYTKLFKALKDSGREKELMMAARDVYKTVKGRDFVYEYQTEKTVTEIRYYDFTDKKQVSKAEAEANGDLLSNPDRYIPVALLNKTNNVIGGAQMAMNFIAYGNQNVVTTNPDGSTTLYSMGILIEPQSDKSNRSRYVARPLIDRNAGTSFNMVSKLAFDHLFLQVAALANPGIEEIQFDGYQDKLLVERKYNELLKSFNIADSLGFYDFIKEASVRLKENYDLKLIEDLLGDMPEWEVFYQAAQYVQQNMKKVGHNVDSIQNDILDMRSEDGTRHQFGVRDYNGKVRPVSLRMNTPMHITTSRTLNWQTGKDSTSKWTIGRVDPADRFRMFFTSSFSGFSPSSLSIGFPGQNFDETFRPSTKNVTPSDTTVDTAPIDDTIVDEENINEEELIVEEVETSKPKVVRYYWRLNPNRFLTDQEVEDLKRDGYVMLENPITFADQEVTEDEIEEDEFDEDDTDVAKLRVTEASMNTLNNMPEGERLSNVDEMLSYLRNFIPDIQESDLQLLTDIQANMFFNQTSKDGLFGAFKNGIIYAVTGSNNDPVFKQLLKHEAFHKIFRQYLTKDQRARIIEQAREEFNLYGLSALEVEEFLAVNFQKRPDFNRNSLLQRFLNFLRRIYYLIFRHGNTIENFYKKIESGYFGSFGKQVNADEQFNPKETAYLQSKDIFSDNERLITTARGIFNSALSKAELQRNETNVRNNFVKNAPKSDFEKMAFVFDTLHSRLFNEKTGLKSRRFQSKSYVYSAYDEAGSLRILTDQELRNYTQAGRTIYANAYMGKNEIDPSTLIRLQRDDDGYPNPLSSSEMDELNVLSTLFNQTGRQNNPKDFDKLAIGDELKLKGGTFKVVKIKKGVITVQNLDDAKLKRDITAVEYKNFGSWNFVGTKIYPNLLVFVKTEYPTYFRNLSKYTGFERTYDHLEAAAKLSEDEVKEMFKSLNIGESEGNFILDALSEEKATVSILTQILDKESTVDPSTTLTENIKSWMSQLFVTTPSGKRPINVKIAQAILYSKIHFYNTNNYEEFENSINSSFDIESYSFKIYDEGYIQDLLENSNSEAVKVFFKELHKKHGISTRPDNYIEVAKYVKIEFDNFINQLVTNGTLTDLASNKNGNLIHLYSKGLRKEQSVNSIWKDIKTVQKIVNDYKALGGKNVEAIVLNDINNQVDRFVQEEINKLGRFVRLRKDDTEETFEARKDEFIRNAKAKGEEKRAELMKEYNNLSTTQLNERANKIREKYKRDQSYKLYDQYKNPKSKLYKDLYNKLSISGNITYYGQPEQVVLRNKILELARNSYKDGITFYDETIGRDVKVPFPDHYYFKDDNTFYMNGVVIKRDRNTLSNGAFFSKIWQEWQANTDPKLFANHSIRMITDLYLKHTSNKIFLDIMTGHNNLTPTNLTAFEMSRNLGVVSAALKTKQEDDSSAKLALSITKVMLDMMTESKTTPDGRTYPVLKSDVFKEFISKYLPGRKYVHDKSTAINYYYSFLELLKLTEYFSEPRNPNDLQKVNEYLGQMIIKIDNKYGKEGGVANDEDEEFDVLWFQQESFNYLKTLTRFINRNRETQTVTSVKDVNGKQRFFRENKSFADQLTFLLNDYRNETKSEYRKAFLKALIEERYPHLRSVINGRDNFMILNPFNVLNDNPMYNRDKLNKMEAEFMNLDGTLINEYSISLNKEVYKDFLNRMLNGHFIAVVNDLRKDSVKGSSQATATTYPIADKERLKMMRTGIYPLNQNDGKASVKDMLKLMLVQRVMMPAKMDHIKTYSPWKDNKGLYHLDGLEEVEKEHKDQFKKLVALTGSTKSFADTIAKLKKDKIDIDQMVDTWYNTIIERSEGIANDIVSLNKMSLAASGKMPSLRHGVSIVSNLASVYEKLLNDGVLTEADFEGNPDIQIVDTSVEGEPSFSIVLKNFSAKAKSYNVTTDHLKPLMKVFYTHVYINDFFLNQITQGDPAFFPDAVTLVKRLSSAHGTIKSPMVSPSHAPSTINTLVVEDPTLYKFNGIVPVPGLKDEYSVEEFNELLKSKSVKEQQELREMYTKTEVMDGGGYMSARARDLFNRGFGENMKMGDSIKPLAHWFTENGNPMNTKYSLAVITDEYARKFPKMFELRNKMDFHGLSPKEFKEAVELERKRLYNEIRPETHLAEFRRLQELYDKADSIHQVVPQSSVKFGKRKNVGTFNYKTGNFDGFGFSDITDAEYDALTDEQKGNISKLVLKLGTREFGLQLNPSDKPDSKVSLPTQLLYFSNVNGENALEQGRIQKALIKLQGLAGREYLTSGINGDKTSIEAIRDLVMGQLRGKNNHLNTYSALGVSPSMSNLPLFSNTVSSNFDNAFEKNFLNVSFKGTKGVQVSEALTSDNLGEELKYDASTSTAEVYMPLSYRDEILSQAASKYQEWFAETDPVKRKKFEDSVFKIIDDKESIVRTDKELYEKWKAEPKAKQRDAIAKEAWDKIANKKEYMRPETDLFTKYKRETNINKKMELEKKILDLMPVMMLGFRIPTTGLNSAVRIKIKGFVNEANNRVILPSEVVIRMGSDFDIDTLYILRPELLGGTPRKNAIARKLGIEPNTPVGYSFDGKEIKGFEDMIARLRQDPTASYTYTDRDGNVITQDIQISDKELLNIERAYYRNMFAFNYMDIITKQANLNDVNKALNFDRATSLLPLNDGSKSLYVLLAELKSDSFRIAYNKAIKSDDPKTSIYNPDVYDRLKSQMENEIERSYNLTNLVDRADLQILNQTGKNLTGIFASISKTLAYVQDTFTKETGIKVSDSLTFTINGLTYNGTPKYNSKTDRLEFWTVGEKEGKSIEIRTFDELQWMVNAAVDNAKEQILAKLNINATTSNATNGALTMGLPMEDLLVLLQQPVAKELIKLGRISDDVISYLKTQLLNAAGVELNDQTLSAVSKSFTSRYNFTTKNVKGGVNIGRFIDAKIYESRNVRAVQNLDTHSILSVTSTYKHPFTFNGTTYKSIYEAHYMEYLKSLGYENNKEYVDDYKNTENANVPYDITDIYKAYLNSFDQKFLDSLIGQNFTFDARFKSNIQAMEVLNKYISKKVSKNDTLYQILQNEELLASQLYTLDMINKLNTVGDAMYKLQNIMNIITDTPNGDSSIVAFENSMAEVFQVENRIANTESFIGLKDYTHIELPAKVSDLVFKKSFPIKDLNLNAIPLFVEAYENWHTYVYTPQLTARIAQNRKLAESIDRLQQLQGISPKHKQDTRLEEEKQVTLMRATLIKTLLSKTYIAAPNQYGVVENIPMSTIGKTYTRKGVEYFGKRALFEQLSDMVTAARFGGRNADNLFLMQLAKEPYNVKLRTGEIKMKRQNTSDDVEILQLKSAFLNLDQDLRNEFMANNPNYEGYWLSPFQKLLIQYAVIFEGFSFGSSKLSLYLPNDIAVQIADQLEAIFNDLDKNDLFKELEHYYGLELIAGEPEWNSNVSFKRAVGVSDQPQIIDFDETISTEKRTNEEIEKEERLNQGDTETEENKIKKTLQASTVKYNGKLGIYYHLMIEAPKGVSANSLPLYIHESFENDHTPYIRLIPTQKVGDKEYAFYLMVPRSSSTSPELPETVLNDGFNIDAMRSGKNVFINERYSIIKEDNKPVLYSKGNLVLNSVIYAYDHNVRGYMQSLQGYEVVDYRAANPDKENRFNELVARLNRPGITSEGKEDILKLMKEYQTRYVLKKVGSPIAIQNLSDKKGSDKLRNSLLNTVPGTDSILLKGIMEFDRINNNGIFDSSVYTDEEKHLYSMRQKEGRLTCKR